MRLLPNYKKAFIAIEKLTDYCLNQHHPAGKQKAIVFKSALDITSIHALLLKEAIADGLSKYECLQKEADFYGVRFSVKMNIRIFEKEAQIITSWIIRSGEDFPRLTSCYIKR